VLTKAKTKGKGQTRSGAHPWSDHTWRTREKKGQEGGKKKPRGRLKWGKRKFRARRGASEGRTFTQAQRNDGARLVKPDFSRADRFEIEKNEDRLEKIPQKKEK